MKPRLLLSHRTWVAASLVATLLGGCTPTNQDTVRTPAETAESEDQMHTVVISKMKFIPEELVVHKGDRVVFVNNDIVTHDITEEESKAWSSSPLAANQEWTLTATQTSNYYCTLHPTMKGKIIVQ